MTPPDRPVSARLEELREKLAAGTPGPFTFWRYSHGAGRVAKDPDTDSRTLVADFYHAADLDLYEAMLLTVPVLLDIAERAADLLEYAGTHDDDLGGTWGNHNPSDADVLRAALDRLNTEDGAGR